ncbi:MAG TPA: hypothetical protein VIY51_08440 [Xanthobacteraceae bacterium]
MKDLVFDLDGNDLARPNAGGHRAGANIVDEARKPREADEIEGGTRRAKSGGGRILPTLEENRFDDVHDLRAEGRNSSITGQRPDLLP